MARAKHWSMIVYPDSVDLKWKMRLKAQHIRTAISPLHDPSKNPDADEVEEERKVHYHVVVEYDTLKSAKQVIEGVKDIIGLGCTNPQIIQSPTGYVRYLIHKDNPEKEQFEWRDIEIYNGFELEKYDTYTEKELDVIFSDITKFIDDNDIMEYSDLTQVVRDPDNELFEWYRIVRKNTVYFNSYICSRRNKYKEWMKQKQLMKQQQQKEI